MTTQTRSAVPGTLLLGILCAFALPYRLYASCGQAFCPIETSSIVENPLGGGQLYLNFVYEHIDQDIPYTGTNRVRVGRVPRFHDEISTRNHTYKLTLDYGVTPRLTVGALFPFLDRLHRHIDNEDQEVIGEGLGETEIVRVPNRWRYIEFGDMQLTARYLLLPQTTPYTPALSLIVGVKLPTGRTGVRNSDGEKAELTLQPGNGAWDGIVGLSVVKNFSVQTVRRETALAPVFVTALGRFPVGTGKFGYRPGGETFLNIGLAYPLFRRVDFLGQLNFHYKDRDDIGHAPGVEQADTGREELFLSPGIRYRLTDSMAIYALVQFTLYRRVNGIQLTSDWNFTSGIFYRFNLLS
jgi:hypothetical protein